MLENLLLAAKLRLPVSHRGRCGCTTADCRHWERARHRDVRRVVGEVMALMALTKVATKVSCLCGWVIFCVWGGGDGGKGDYV